MTFGVAVVGYGRMGLIHAQNVVDNPRTTLLYLVGSNMSTLEPVASQFQGVTPCTDLSVPLKDPNVKGVIICSPSQNHPDHIVQSLKAGKAVFCEKPIALSAEEIKLCFDTAEECKLPLLCGYQRRFDDDLIKVKEMTTTNTGKVQLLRLTSRDHPPPPEEYLNAPSSGSFFDDFSTHDVDVARWIMEEEPETIYATASQFLGPAKFDDTAVIVMKFPSGGLCIVDNSRQTSYGYDIRLEALGPKGMISLTNPSSSNIIWSAHHGHTSPSAPYSFPQRFAQAYKNELNHWIDVCEGSDSLKITQDDCLQAVKITTYAQESRSKQISPSTDCAKKSSTEPYPTVDSGSLIGVIIFGTGRMGRLRAQSIQGLPNVKLLYAFDIVEASVNAFVDEYPCEGQVLTEEAVEKALADPRVKAVFVSTTSSSHYPLMKSSLTAGKHVFCEKPLALTAAHTEEAVDLANQKKLALYCGFQRRSDKHFSHLKKSLSGSIQLVRVSSRESSALNTIAYLLASGGFLFDSVIHDIDMACYITGEYPIEVYSQGTAFNEQLKEVGDVDAIVVVLRFPSGAIASIDNHRNTVYGYDQRVEVHTSTGVFFADNLGNTAVRIGDSKGFSSDNPPDFVTRYDRAYRDETVHFISLLKGIDVEPRSVSSDYAVTARVAEAAQQSLKTGKPVSLI